MRTSLNDIRKIEHYLSGNLNNEDLLQFQARLLTEPILKLNLFVQEKIFALLHLYHRKKLKEELESVHQRLFSDPAKTVFQESIGQLFKQ